MAEGKIRIIGGKWRGRNLNVLNSPLLRPTPDRVRETLFNWLMYDINGARCLDLFAGTGALGLEALSRGASELIFVEKDQKLAQQLLKILKELSVATLTQVVIEDAVAWLEKAQATIKPFDIIFLDPPFASSLLTSILNLLANGSLTLPTTKIYIESPQPLKKEELPVNWQILKQKNAGEVAYHLIGL